MLNPEILEFIAQNEMIEIIPNFTQEKWSLYSVIIIKIKQFIKYSKQ